MTLPAFAEDFDRALIVVAHPDDIEYGTAAAVARWTLAGKTVTYLLATRGEAGIDGMDPAEAGPIRAQEERDSAAEVGVDTVEFLDYSDGIVEYGLDLRRDIARAIRHHRPEVVISGSFDLRFAGGITNQADHRAVGLATLDAARDAGNRWIFPDLLADGYEPWDGVHQVAFAGALNPTHAVDVTDTFDAGVASLAAHARYLAGLGPDYPSPHELLDGILSRGGELAGTRYALTLEVFQI